MSPTRIYCVDHDPISRIVLESLFERDFVVEVFDDAPACLARMTQQCPDLLLLDVELPAMNSFVLCRQIKADPAFSGVAVLFISHVEDLAVRLEAYESGAEDFILKPYAVDEVRRRVAVVQKSLQAVQRLRSQIDDSEMLSTLLLSSMDEYAVLIKFMRALNESETIEAIADALLIMLRAFHLQGAVQIRTPWTTLTLSEAGRDRPLEQAVIAHLSKMERIFEFKARSVYNFERSTLLIHDMPTQDPELCGRLRDHLAIAAEMADARIQSLIGQHALQATEAGLAAVVQETSHALAKYVDDRRTLRRESAERLHALMNSLTLSIVPLGLNSELEEEIVELVHSRTRDILQLALASDDAVETLTGLVDKLRQVVRQAH